MSSACVPCSAIFPLSITRILLRIRESRGFVKHYYGRILQYGAGESYPLLLASGEPGAFGAYPGVKSVRKPVDYLPALRGIHGPFNLFEACLGSSVANVFQQRCLEEASRLEDEGDVVHQFLRQYVPDIDTSYQDMAFVSLPESRDQPCYGCLASSGFAYKGISLACRRRKSIPSTALTHVPG